MKKIKILSVLLGLFILTSCTIDKKVEISNLDFLKVSGVDIVKANGDKFFIQGINLGNWLNPEGYMFLFGSEAASFRLIDQAFCELVGPDFVKEFWLKFKENYITHDDIKFIKSTGMNSIRIPFHYKMFTDEDYMGLHANQDGFEQLDKVIDWCRQEELYVILDMHDAPGGQTGDNIDDSYGYPWLFIDEPSQELFCSIWKDIADYYKEDTIILGYDLINEPIAHYFENDPQNFNAKLEPLYMRCVDSIRTVDSNHIIILGGAQWSGNFSMFTNSTFDDNLMYTCHRYWCDTLQADIEDLVHFRDSVNLPIYMGETGENSDEWIAGWTNLLERNNIGWHYWPYKKMEVSSCMASFAPPENWNLVVDYTKQDRSTFEKIRAVRPDQNVIKRAMLELLENIKFENSRVNPGYIKAVGMKP